MSDDPISFDHLSSLDPKKLEIIKFVISSCHGKPLELILPDLMAASSRLSEQGLSFTNEEISMIIDGGCIEKMVITLLRCNRYWYGSHHRNAQIGFSPLL